MLNVFFLKQTKDFKKHDSMFNTKIASALKWPQYFELIEKFANSLRGTNKAGWSLIRLDEAVNNEIGYPRYFVVKSFFRNVPL